MNQISLWLFVIFFAPTILAEGYPETPANSETLDKEVEIKNKVDDPAERNHCVYWCRRPNLSYYCCHYGMMPPKPVEVHMGHCPCPCHTPDYPCPDYFQEPPTCKGDGDCELNEKCCYDSCVGRHICKIAHLGPMLDMD